MKKKERWTERELKVKIDEKVGKRAKTQTDSEMQLRFSAPNSTRNCWI